VEEDDRGTEAELYALILQTEFYNFFSKKCVE
jgi:hypothetical protein